MQVAIYKPELPAFDEVEPELREMFDSGMLYPGKYTDRLVESMKTYLQVEHIMPVNSCSSGLMILVALLYRLGRKLSPSQGKIIIPGFTFNATLQAVQWGGYTPVCIDVDDNGQLRPDLVREYLRQHQDVAAVMPVHMWGNACYPEEYDQLHQEFGIPVFFDGAHVLGTNYKGVSLANFGSAVVFSIAATKPLSAGEGGLICTNDRQIFEDSRHVTFHGLFNSLDTRLPGLNAKTQEFNSIVAFHALKKFDKTRATRAAILDFYREALAGLPLRVWKAREGVDASYKDCVIFAESRVVRDALELHLNVQGVGTKRYFDPAVPDMGYFNGIDAGCENSRKLSDQCLTIPLYPALTRGELDYVVSTIRDFYARG